MRAAFDSINGRILLIPTVALIALIVVGFVAVRTIGNITLAEHQARALYGGGGSNDNRRGLRGQGCEGRDDRTSCPIGREGGSPRRPF